MRLWSRLTLLNGSLLVFTLVVTLVYAVNSSTGVARTTSRQLVAAEARAEAALLQRWIMDTKVGLQRYTEVLRLEPEMSDEVKFRFLQAITESVEGVALAALHDEQMALAGIPASAEEGSSRRPVPTGHIQQAVALGGRFTAADIVEGRLAIGDAYGCGDEVCVPVAWRVQLSREVEPLIVTLELRSGRVIQELFRELPQELGQRWVVDGQGRGLLGSPGTALFQDALQSADGLIQRNGEVLLAEVAEVPDTPWSVILLVPSDAWERPAIELERRLLWVALVSLLVAILGAVAVSRSIALPIQRLRDVALEVADGDLGRQVAAVSTGEVVELTEAFNFMSQRLAENRDELQAHQLEIEQFNEELQHRIDAATEELRAAQEELVTSGQLAAVGELGAGLAHELNNPLAGILGLVQMLRMAELSAGTQEMLADIESEALRCREVVAAMLALSEPINDRDDAEQVVSVSKLMDEIRRIARGAAQQRNIQVKRVHIDSGLMARASTAALRRVLAQLLTALIASLPGGSTLLIEGMRRDERIVLRFTSDSPIASGVERDDFLASGLAVWSARQQLVSFGGHLEIEEGTWIVRLLVAG